MNARNKLLEYLFHIGMPTDRQLQTYWLRNHWSFINPRKISGVGEKTIAAFLQDYGFKEVRTLANQYLPW